MAGIILNRIGLIITDGESVLLLESNGNYIIPNVDVDEEGNFFDIITKKFKENYNINLKKFEKRISDMGPFNPVRNMRFFILILDGKELPDISKLKQNIQIVNRNDKFIIKSSIYNIEYVDIEKLVFLNGMIKIIGMFIRTYFLKNGIKFGKNRRNLLTKRESNEIKKNI